MPTLAEPLYTSLNHNYVLKLYISKELILHFIKPSTDFIIMCTE